MPFQIVRNDITKVKADAIVNTANPYPKIGNGTDSAIYNAAGKERLLSERQKIGNIEVGMAVATPAFNLSANYIIHTVGPMWTGGDNGEYDKLRDCYENSLSLAIKLGCKSIAFPLISSGIYRFPKDEALKIAIAVFDDFLLENDIVVYLLSHFLTLFPLRNSPDTMICSATLVPSIDSTSLRTDSFPIMSAF